MTELTSSNRFVQVGFGEVWNILGSVVIGSRRLRQASGCRSFFFSPSILGNDNVLYHSLSGLATPQEVSRSFFEIATIRSGDLLLNGIPRPWRVSRY
jgi:hypothetical protein